MQVEEVIHTSRLYSILVKERALDTREHEDLDLWPAWSKHALLSEIKSVQRTLSRKLSTLRRRPKKKRAGSDCDSNRAISPDPPQCHNNTSHPSNVRVTVSAASDHNQDVDNDDDSPAVNCGLSRLFGSFRSHHKPKPEPSDCKNPVSTKAADISHEEIVSGRDSAYFSLTLTHSDESEVEEGVSKVHDESQDSILSGNRRHAACQTEPKKNVTLLLPDTRPHHLQSHTVRIHELDNDGGIRLDPDHDISRQLDTIILQAKIQLLSSFPKYNFSINLIFSQHNRKYFINLNSSQIGDYHPTVMDIKYLFIQSQMMKLIRKWELWMNGLSMAIRDFQFDRWLYGGSNTNTP